jgi:hypothetical protein
MKQSIMLRTATMFLGLIVGIGLAFAQTSQPMPPIGGESFAGQKVELPDAAHGKVAVLVFGFTKASKVPTSAWTQKINADFGSRNDFELYELPVLEDVPRFIRGMVISSIKKGVPENRRSHFVPIVQNEAELKTLVNYKEPDDAYLVALDTNGQIVAQTHGPFTDAAYAKFRPNLESLISRSQTQSTVR